MNIDFLSFPSKFIEPNYSGTTLCIN